MGLGPGSGGAEVATGLEEPMNFTDTGGVFFFFCGGVAVRAGLCSTSLVAGLVTSDP